MKTLFLFFLSLNVSALENYTLNGKGIAIHAKDKEYIWYEPESNSVKFDVVTKNLCQEKFKDRVVTKEYADELWDKDCYLKTESSNCPTGFKFKEDSKYGKICAGRLKQNCPKGFYSSISGVECKMNVAKDCEAGFTLSNDKEYCFKCHLGGEIDYKKHSFMKCLGSYCADFRTCKLKI